MSYCFISSSKTCNKLELTMSFYFFNTSCKVCTKTYLLGLTVLYIRPMYHLHRYHQFRFVSSTFSQQISNVSLHSLCKYETLMSELFVVCNSFKGVFVVAIVVWLVYSCCVGGGLFYAGLRSGLFIERTQYPNLLF